MCVCVCAIEDYIVLYLVSETDDMCFCVWHAVSGVYQEDNLLLLENSDSGTPSPYAAVNSSCSTVDFMLFWEA